jgi:hypothetical protein
VSDAPISWSALLALGAGHGINPAMGWLFAVALGLQRGSRRAVWGSLVPLGLGHAMAMVATIAAAAVIGLVLPPAVLRWTIAGLLVGLGVYRLVRARHIAYGGMQVNSAELATWSFLMASAHGAGLMLLPLVLGDPTAPAHAHHLVAASMINLGSVEWTRVIAAAVHTAGYLLVTGVIAVIVYEKVGLRFLRTAWVNLDLVWAIALVITDVATALA